MKSLFTFSILLSFLSLQLSAKDCAPTKIAKVDYQKVQYLQMDPEIKVEVTSLKKKMKELLLQIVKEEEEEKIEELQKKHRVYQSKMFLDSIDSLFRSFLRLPNGDQELRNRELCEGISCDN